MKPYLPTCEQCFGEFVEALEELRELTEEVNRHKDDLEKYRPDIVRLFETSHEKALDTMRTYFKEQGRPPFSGSRDITVEAFHEDLIDDGQGWLDMIIARIQYNPLYPGNYLGSISENIIKKYFSLLENFERNFKKQMDK
ncbi:nucleotidyltransferase substrate binding protein [Pleomorphovibrio marinus]|uniref:nucleotidyltransferase substrate binding protein n=1 Tax=Pleomorphovibrio marinus TaxID=2164132 RepID=UPI000E0BAD08|nr:nucleotidyltransferase substrate binding protein [Pleomorphovibrio marinus]